MVIEKQREPQERLRKKWQQQGNDTDNPTHFLIWMEKHKEYWISTIKGQKDNSN